MLQEEAKKKIKASSKAMLSVSKIKQRVPSWFLILWGPTFSSGDQQSNVQPIF